MTQPKTTTAHKGKCHCGSVQFEAVLVNGLNTASRCTCSMCRMRGAVAVTAKVGDLKITQGQDKLTLYQFNTHTAKHYFCSGCGIYTHHQRRSNPDQFSVNVACLEGVSPFDFEEVPVFDGIHHVKDGPAGRGPQRAGVLKYIKGD